MWGSRGFSPVGRIDQRGNNPFTGSLDGQGFTINALMLAPNNATTQSVGLFGTIGADGSVMNLNITNASVAANIGLQQPVEGGPVSQWVGILAGQSGGTITNVTVAGTVSGLSMSGVIAGGLVGQHGILGPNSSAGTITNAHANVNVTVADGMTCPGTCMFNAAGGLVGVNVGGSSIANSSAAGNVSGGAFTWAGGLVGQNGFFNPANSSGTITNSFATGNVSVAGLDLAAGGLVGSNVPGSTITGSHATGAVAASGGATAGGFVGENHGAITTSYATGPVTLTNSGATDAVAGGFAGTNEGTISGSHATGAVTSTNGDVTLGGFVGVNSNGITNSYATGNVTANGATLAMLGGFAGGNAGTITQSHATGNVSTNAATAMAGGFVGLNFGEIHPVLRHRQRRRGQQQFRRRLCWLQFRHDQSGLRPGRGDGRREQLRRRICRSQCCRRPQPVRPRGGRSAGREPRRRLDHAILCAWFRDRRQRDRGRRASRRSISDRSIRSMVPAACKGNKQHARRPRRLEQRHAGFTEPV